MKREKLGLQADLVITVFPEQREEMALVVLEIQGLMELKVNEVKMELMGCLEIEESLASQVPLDAQVWEQMGSVEHLVRTAFLDSLELRENLELPELPEPRETLGVLEILVCEVRPETRVRLEPREQAGPRENQDGLFLVETE